MGMKVIRNDDIGEPEGETFGKLESGKSKELVNRNLEVCSKCDCFNSEEETFRDKSEGFFYSCKIDPSRRYGMRKAMFEGTPASFLTCKHIDELKANPPWKGKILRSLEICRTCPNFCERKHSKSDTALYTCLIPDGKCYTTIGKYEKNIVPDACLFMTEYLLHGWDKGDEQNDKGN